MLLTAPLEKLVEMFSLSRRCFRPSLLLSTEQPFLSPVFSFNSFIFGIVLGKTGDFSLIPSLASYLQQRQLNSDVAEAMMEILFRHSDPEVNSLMMRGCRIMQNSGEQEIALSLFSQAVEIDPAFAEVR